MCINCIRDGVLSSSFLLDIIIHVYRSLVSVLSGSLSALRFQPTLNGCLERFCIRTLAVHLGVFVGQATFSIPLSGKMIMRIAGRASSWNTRPRTWGRTWFALLGCARRPVHPKPVKQGFVFATVKKKRVFVAKVLPLSHGCLLAGS